MKDSNTQDLPEQQIRRGHGIQVGNILGIKIYLDFSLVIIFSLLVWHLGANVFPAWHQDWSPGLSWAVGCSAGLLFFASLLLHEMAHSLMALKFGISVPRITLFLFGGVSEIAEEPGTPKKEFLIAIVGPLTSLILGVVFSTLAAYLAGGEFAALLLEDQEAALASLHPLPTLLFWLGPINILLGLFNLVPGFPLDGGRVLRAALWWMTDDLDRATRIASNTGRLFGWFLMALGIFQALSGAFLQGLWLLLIGWFLAGAATSSYAQLAIRQALKGRTVNELMRHRFETVDGSLSLISFINDYLLQSTQVLWPVMDGDQPVGFATLEEVKKVPPEDRGTRRVLDIMLDKSDELTVHPAMDAMKVMQKLGSRDIPLAVVENDRVVGLLSQADAVKWLSLHDH